MDIKIIQEMMHDSNFDPSIWVLDAIQDYVGRKLQVLIPDPVTRKYLFKGMAGYDIETVANYIIKHFRLQDPDMFATISEEFMDAIITRSVDDFYNSNAAYKILLANNCRSSLLKKYVTLQDVSKPLDKLICYMDNNDVKTMLRNWNSRNWSYQDFLLIIDRLKTELFEHKEIIFSQLDRYGQNAAVYIIQSVLAKMTRSIPDSLAKDWYEWLMIVKINNIYLSSSNNETYKAPSRSGVQFSELLCRCGRFLKTKSGLSNHRRVCRWGKKSNLLVLAKRKMAKADPNLLICEHCGLTCKTKSGLTLHKKGHKNVEGPNPA